MIKTTIIGRATQDFKLRKNGEDRSWGVFTVASNRSYIKKGAEEPEADYISIYVSGKFAEICSEHIKKGMHIVAIGDLEINRSTSDDDKAYTNVEMRNADIQWFSKKE